MSDQRGIQSIEVGGTLLQALAHHGRPLALKDLAALAGMAPAKAHPYLVSFGKLGLVEQDADSGRYGLGPLAMQLGLISLQALNPLALATPVIERLAAACGHTVAIAVWGDRGATIVRVAEAPTPVHVSMRHGTVMSLTRTASGRLFAAWLPKAQTRALLQREKPAPGFAAVLAAVRRDGCAQVEGVLLPGISALAAPVFDGSGALVLALTAIGATPGFDARPTGALAGAVKEAAARLSSQLGGRAPAGPGDQSPE